MKTKKFDAVGFMRQQRIEIEEEDAGLSWEERRKKTLKLLEDDPLWRRLRKRTVRAAGKAPQHKALPKW